MSRSKGFRCYRFHIQLDAKKVKSYYLKPFLRLRTQSICGAVLSIPMKNFQQYFHHDGLSGFFEAQVNEQGKIINIHKVR